MAKMLGSSGEKNQKTICACGGEIKVHATGTRGKLRMVAECQSCKKTARKPKDLLDRSIEIFKDS